MKLTSGFLLLFIFVSGFRPLGHSEAIKREIVLCVDLSASTNGILHDIRTQLWTIINSSYKEPNSILRIGVVGYARPSFKASNSYIRIISDLTTDFDFIAYSLYQLKVQIEKGDQYVPNALKKTLTQITWDNNPNTTRVVYLIGNGSAYTGTQNLVNICEEFKKRNIVINSIYVDSDYRDFANAQGYHTIAKMTGGQLFRFKPSKQVEWDSNNITKAGLFYNMNHVFNSTFMFYTADASDRKQYLYDTDKFTLQNGIPYFLQRLKYKVSDSYQQTAEKYDLISYYLRNHSLPEKINMDFISQYDKVRSLDQVEEKVKQKAVARTKLLDEMRYIFDEETDINQQDADTSFNNIIIKQFN
ncbi:MAG: VWA domain-containing protein [Bacteroidia bacterium]|nr:VWA domain-containing protein [Bacteroidia bacterium]MCZ2276789.1 VWA domain-containing protein [Bacteroidia bacterium]